jgi:hypothetical protein
MLRRTSLVSFDQQFATVIFLSLSSVYPPVARGAGITYQTRARC